MNTMKIKEYPSAFAHGYDKAREQIAIGEDPLDLLRQAESDIDEDGFNKGWVHACNEAIGK